MTSSNLRDLCRGSLRSCNRVALFLKTPNHPLFRGHGLTLLKVIVAKVLVRFTCLEYVVRNDEDLVSTTMAARFFPFRPEIDQNFALRNVRVLAAAHAASTSAVLRL